MILGGNLFRIDIFNEQVNSIYEESGVNIEEGNKVVQKIMGSIESTHDENVESVRGDFGGLYNLGRFFLKIGMMNLLWLVPQMGWELKPFLF